MSSVPVTKTDKIASSQKFTLFNVLCSTVTVLLTPNIVPKFVSIPRFFGHKRCNFGFWNKSNTAYIDDYCIEQKYLQFSTQY